MTELAQPWRKVELVPEGYHMIVGERFPRRRKHHMRERRKFEARYMGKTAYRRWPVRNLMPSPEPA